MTTAGEATLKLRVAEALNKDVARAFARIGPEDLDKLGAASGDIVEISGKRTTVCKAMLAHMDMRQQSRIQLDGLVRENAGAALDEFVQVRKISCRPAERVVLAPVNFTPSERDLNYIGSLLDGLPVMEGNRIRATLFGSRWADFKVESTAPKGPVLIIRPRNWWSEGSADATKEPGAYLLRGHRRAEVAAAPHPRDDRAAAALSRGVRAAGDRAAQGRTAATDLRAAARP